MTHSYRIVPLKKRTEDAQAYAEMMAHELSLVRREKKEASTTQCASTQALIDRDPALDEIMKLRIPDPATYRVPVVEREISVEEFNLIEGMRRRKKNTLGQSEKSASTQERKALAIDAFIFTPPAPLTDLQMKELTKLEQIKELKKIEVWKEMTFWQAFIHWIKGNKIKEEDIK